MAAGKGNVFGCAQKRRLPYGREREKKRVRIFPRQVSEVPPAARLAARLASVSLTPHKIHHIVDTVLTF